MHNEGEITEEEIKVYKNKFVQILMMEGNTLKQTFSKNYSGSIDSDIPNIGITLNNKIVELQHEFEKKGLSFYTTRIRKEGAYYDNMLFISFVGKAIRDDLYNICTNSLNDLSICTKKIHTVLLTKNTELITTEKKNPIVSFFSKLWNFLFPHNNKKNNNNNQKIYSDSINELNSHIEQYKETNKKLENYNLKNNIVDSVVNYIVKEQYEPMDIPGLIEEIVIPDFEKLGFSDLIPELKDKLIEAYKVLSEKNPFKYYTLPDFNKKDELSTNSLDELVKIKKHHLSDIKELFEYSDDTDAR